MWPNFLIDVVDVHLNSTAVFQSSEKSTELEEKSYVFLCSDPCNFLKVLCPLYMIFFSFSCTLSRLQSFCFTIIFVLRAFNKRWTFPKIAFALNVFNFFFKEKADLWNLKWNISNENTILLPLCEARLKKNYNLTKKKWMSSLFFALNIMSEQVTTFNMSDLFPSLKGTSVTQKFKHSTTWAKIFPFWLILYDIYGKSWLNINLSFVLGKMFFVFYFFQLRLFSWRALQRKKL